MPLVPGRSARSVSDRRERRPVWQNQLGARDQCIRQHNVFHLQPWRQGTTGAEPERSRSSFQRTDRKCGPRGCWRKHAASAALGKSRSPCQHTDREPRPRRCTAVST